MPSWQCYGLIGSQIELAFDAFPKDRGICPVYNYAAVSGSAQQPDIDSIEELSPAVSIGRNNQPGHALHSVRSLRFRLSAFFALTGASLLSLRWLIALQSTGNPESNLAPDEEQSGFNFRPRT
jgi:hypothetical protein